jgi:carbon monoxide dehydrogenase subunit G
LKLSGNFTFDAEPGAVWTVLMNPDAIASALPGVNGLVPIEGETHAWRATAKLGIASVSGSYTGTVRMSDIEAPTQFVLTVSGEGQQSIINGSAHLHLADSPDAGKTLLTWEAEANISGRLASIAQRLIVAAASLLSKQFFQGLEKQIKTEKSG